jgi:hypothetical protein
MYKCGFGTYCPPKSSFEIACPGGTYGSGNPQNYDEESACLECGRGLYAVQNEDNPAEQKCEDCTPGYVCVGRTSKATPINVSAHGGYKCPTGHYCPLGSFEELQCPIGRYNKRMGMAKKTDCIKCKVGFYGDEPGQAGCKKCGPTSTSEGGSLTCTCSGFGRNFIKSMGACFCKKGYKPKNDQPNDDSSEDCEAIVKQVCSEDQELTQDGNCLATADDEEKYCNRYCSTGGFVVPGTG